MDMFNLSGHIDIIPFALVKSFILGAEIHLIRHLFLLIYPFLLHGEFAVSDYFQLEDLLSPEDVALRKRIRDVMEKHVAPVMAKVNLYSRLHFTSLQVRC